MFNLDFSTSDQRYYYQHMIPNSLHETEILESDSSVYGGRFSPSGNLYYASTQDDLFLFDT